MGLRNAPSRVWVMLLVVYAGTCGASQLDKANELYSEGAFAEAIPVYKQAARSGENPALSYFNLANAYFQLDSVPRSIVYYKACLHHAPDFFRGYLNLAIAYYTLEDVGRCIAKLRRALEIEPANLKARMVLAASYGKAGAYSQAITMFTRLAGEHPEEHEVYVALGEMYRELEDFTEAIKWLARYPSDGGNYGYVLSVLADMSEANGNLAGAVYYLRKALAHKRDGKWLFYRMVSLLDRMENTNVALQEAHRGLELFPAFGELALLAGNLAFGLELYGRAEHFYNVANKNGSAGAVVGLENIRLVRMEKAEEERL